MTLDCAVADLDNDGRYDLVSAQGETNAAQWANKVYLNVGGPVDSLAPSVTGLRSPPAASQLAPVVVHAKVRDHAVTLGVHPDSLADLALAVESFNFPGRDAQSHQPLARGAYQSFVTA